MGILFIYCFVVISLGGSSAGISLGVIHYDGTLDYRCGAPAPPAFFIIIMWVAVHSQLRESPGQTAASARRVRATNLAAAGCLGKRLSGPRLRPKSQHLVAGCVLCVCPLLPGKMLGVDNYDIYEVNVEPNRLLLHTW